ncbi:hypothetical protein, partial [Aeromonas caviae]
RKAAMNLFLWAWQPPERRNRTPFDPDCTRDEQAGFASKNTLLSQAKKVILIFHLRSPDLHLTDRTDENPFAVSVH